MKLATIIGGIAAVALLAGCATNGTDSSAARRVTSLGPVVGVHDTAGGTFSWKGIPFAAPPVGALRWSAPVEPARWTQDRPADRFAAACVQTGRLYGPGRNNRYDETIGSTLGQTLGAEDCLYLNIWQPGKPERAARPVIVFVHGGSNITGYTADPVYDGAALANAADAVVVTVNYRLGIFGFLDHPALKSGDPRQDSGNFALLDIVRALEFVQADIRAFGGDPGRVTLMGQSAGAVNVYALLASPMMAARVPLFHRVIALSGGISTAATLPPGGIPGVLPRSVWSTRGNALLSHALAAEGAAADAPAAAALAAGRGHRANADYLRAKSADELLTVVRTRLAPLGMSASNPVPDGHVVAADPIAAIRAGQYVKVPVLAGITRDETKLFPQLFSLRPSLGGVSGRLPDDAAVFRLAHGYNPEAPPATRVEDWIPPAYLPASQPGTGFDARTRELNRVWFDAIRDDVLNALGTRQGEVWSYRFDWDELPPPFDVIFGAAHTFDLPFVFGNFGPSLYSNFAFTRGNAPGREALARAMMASIGAFAAQGDPNAPALDAHWPAWPGMMVFDADAKQLKVAPR